jgi:hypothetical protein
VACSHQLRGQQLCIAKPTLTKIFDVSPAPDQAMTDSGELFLLLGVVVVIAFGAGMVLVAYFSASLAVLDSTTPWQKAYRCGPPCSSGPDFMVAFFPLWCNSAARGYPALFVDSFFCNYAA